MYANTFRNASGPHALMVLALLVLLPWRAAAEPEIDANPVVNINEAGADELAESLDGVGQVTAEAIVEDRDSNGTFDSPDALSRVSGVGPATVDNNRERIRTD